MSSKHAIDGGTNVNCSVRVLKKLASRVELFFFNTILNFEILLFFGKSIGFVSFPNELASGS